MPEPHSVPVPAVRLIITDSHNRVLVLQRNRSTCAEGQWCLPGGKIDYGETVEQAVCRELKEETGLDCTELHFLFYQDSLPLSEKGMHCINFYFTARVCGEIRLNRESTDHAFIRSDELAAYRIAFRNDEGLERFWKK